MAYFEKAPAQLFHLTHVFLDSLERETGKVEVVWSSPKFFRRCWASSRRSRRARRSSRRTFRGWTFELPEEESWLTEREKSNLSRRLWLSSEFHRRILSKRSSLHCRVCKYEPEYASVVWQSTVSAVLKFSGPCWPGLGCSFIHWEPLTQYTADASATLPLLASPPSIRNFATFPWSFKNTSCC